MSETSRELIGRRVREERLRAGYENQAAFAKSISIDASTLSRIEHGKRGVDSVLLQEIADRLGVTMEALVRDPQQQVTLARRGDADDKVMAGMIRWTDDLLDDMETIARYVGRKSPIG